METVNIPQNTYAANNEERLFKEACAGVLAKFENRNSHELTWSHYPRAVAMKVAEAFISKGYHAKTIDRLGDRCGWFWYGVSISKFRATEDNSYKRIDTVLG